MGKKLVLGNDPFQRGAAPRTPPPTQPAARQTLAVESAAAAPRALPPKAAATPAKPAATPAKPAATPAKPAATPAKTAKPAAKHALKAARPTSVAKAPSAPNAPATAAAKRAPPPPPTPAVTAPAAASPPPKLAASPAPAPAEQAAPAAPSALAAPAELPALLAVADAPPLADGLAAAAVALQRLVGLGGGAPSLDVDEFGRDAAFAADVRPLLEWIGARWFRCDVAGAAKLPAHGPLVLVANRAGTIPWDAAMIALATARAGRPVRPLLEDAIFHLPALGVLFARMGAVRACPENAERILGDGGATLVFPEGANGFGKPFAERYRLQRFGRGGFVKLALRTGARIVPVAVVGSEESQPLLARLPRRLLSLPFTPVTPTFPALGPLGLVPLPTKWHLELAAPIDLSNYGPSAADDDALVMRLAEQVRGTIQAMLDAQLATRRSVFGG